MEPYGEEEGYPQDFNQETDSRQKETERQANSYFSQRSIVRSALGKACKLELNQNTNAAFLGERRGELYLAHQPISYPLLSVSPAWAEEAFKEVGL